MNVIENIVLKNELENIDSPLLEYAKNKESVLVQTLDATGFDPETLFIVIRNTGIIAIDTLICDNFEATYNQYITTPIKVVIRTFEDKLAEDYKTKLNKYITSVFILPELIHASATKDINDVAKEYNVNVTSEEYGVNIFNLFSKYSLKSYFERFTKDIKATDSFNITANILYGVCGSGIIDSKSDNSNIIGIIDDLYSTMTLAAIMKE